MFKRSRVVLACMAVGLAFGVGAAHASILIDDFSSHQARFTVEAGNIGSNSNNLATESTALNAAHAGAGILGGYRDVVIDNSSAISSGFSSAEVKHNVITGLDELSISMAGGTVAQVRLTYDGDATSGNFAHTNFVSDFSGGAGIGFEVASDGSGCIVTDQCRVVSVEMIDAQGQKASYRFQAFDTYPFSAPGDFGFIPALLGFNEVVASVTDVDGWFFENNFDLDQVAGMRATVNLFTDSTSALDFQLRFVTVPDRVPEPASIALMGIALLGLGATRLKRKSQA